MSYKIIKGDAIEIFKRNHKIDILLHGCNCVTRMGAGIAKQLADQFYKVKLKDELYPIHGFDRLGNIDVVNVAPSIKDAIIPKYVCNMYTQPLPGPCASLTAIRMCLMKVAYKFKGMNIIMPLVGCGLGGLDWKDVEPIVKEELKDCNVTVVEYNK